MNFENIKDTRDFIDCSQREIAVKLNVSKSTYARWETGEKIIPLTHLVDLANLTKINPDYIIGLTNKRTTINKNITLDLHIIANNLKNFRHQNKLTQTNLADLLNTTHSVISSYENAKTLIQTSFLYDICKKYNLSLLDILN